MGDSIYDLAFACALRGEGQSKKITFITTPAVKNNTLIELLGFTRIEIPGPWLRSGWVGRPDELLKSVLEFRRLVSSVNRGGIGIDARAGIIERLMVLSASNEFVQIYRYHGRSDRNIRNRILGYHSDHVFVCRSTLASAMGFTNLDQSCHLEWPFLHRLFQPKANKHQILLCPEASMRGKECGVRFWQDLNKTLRHNGFETIVVLSRGGYWQKNYSSMFSNLWLGEIDEFGYLIAESDAIVAVDSFAGHFAAAIGVPVFSLFGPTDPNLWRPWGRRNMWLQPKAAAKIKFSRNNIEKIGPSVMCDLSVANVMDSFLPWFHTVTAK